MKISLERLETCVIQKCTRTEMAQFFGVTEMAISKAIRKLPKFTKKRELIRRLNVICDDLAHEYKNPKMDTMAKILKELRSLMEEEA